VQCPREASGKRSVVSFKKINKILDQILPTKKVGLFVFFFCFCFLPNNTTNNNFPLCQNMDDQSSQTSKRKKKQKKSFSVRAQTIEEVFGEVRVKLKMEL